MTGPSKQVSFHQAVHTPWTQTWCRCRRGKQRSLQPPCRGRSCSGAPRRSRHLLLYFLALFPLPSEYVNNKLRNMLNITYIKEKKKIGFPCSSWKSLQQAKSKSKNKSVEMLLSTVTVKLQYRCCSLNMVFCQWHMYKSWNLSLLLSEEQGMDRRKKPKKKNMKRWRKNPWT